MPPSRIAWRVPAYLPYLQPPLTDAAVADAQRRLGLILPDAYLAALREQNGGHLRYSVRGFEIANQLWGIGPRSPSILEGSLAQQVDGDGWLPPGAAGLVPFAGDGHWYMCMDVRGGRAESAVTYVELESEQDERVADTFAALATMSTPAADERRVGVTTDATLGDAGQRLATALHMSLKDQGDQLYGYPTMHGRAEGPRPVAQFWLSPNEVARGFVRKTDRDYAALVDRLPGTALRIPEHPDCTLLLSGARLSDQELLAACARAGLRARPLEVA